MDTRHAHDAHPHSTSPLRPLGHSYLPGPPPGSPSAGRAAAAEPAFPSYASSAAAPSPSRLLCLILLTPPPAIPCPTPRARAVALGRVASPPRGVGPALLGRRVAPASAVSLSYSARPPPSKSSSSSSGGRGPPCRSSRWSGCAAATDLPPASSCVPTPLAEAEPARLSPPPVVDPNPHLEPPALAGPRAGTSRAMAGRTSRLWLRVTICAQSRRLCQRAPTPRP